MTPTINVFAAAIKLLTEANSKPLGMIVPRNVFFNLQYESGYVKSKFVGGVNREVREVTIDGVRIRESREK